MPGAEMGAYRVAGGLRAGVALVFLSLSLLVVQGAAGAPLERGEVILKAGGGAGIYSPDGYFIGTFPVVPTCFSPDGRFLLVPGGGLFDDFGDPLPSQWSLDKPGGGCAVDNSGQVYVAAGPSGWGPRGRWSGEAWGTIEKFNLTGELLATYTVSDDGELYGPQVVDLALAPDGCELLYVNYGGQRVNRYDPCTETQETPIGRVYQASELLVRPNGQILVAGETRVELLGPAGESLRSWTFPIARPGQGGHLYPRSLALDPDGVSAWMEATPSPAGFCVYRLNLEVAEEAISKWREPCGYLAVAPVSAPPSPAEVSAVSPSAGLGAGGASVTISGFRFDEVTAVRFGALEARSFTVNSASQITAIAPPGAGTADVTVTTSLGTSATTPDDEYTYVPSGAAPAIRKLSVDHGPAAGGVSLTITGTGFLGVTGIDIGASSVERLTVNSPTSITLMLPPGTSGTGDVTVSTPNGTSAATRRSRFSYGPPVITSVAQLEYENGDGTGVDSIRGSGFAPGSQTVFNVVGRPLTSVSCPSSSYCTANQPPETRRVGPHLAIVAVVGGRRSKPVHYTYSP
jgi:hypothetical protein